jgi:hypothetical protein
MDVCSLERSWFTSCFSFILGILSCYALLPGGYMNRVIVLVVGLALCSIPVLAGEYLMNDTGQTVYGLRVTFSEPVTISGYGDALTTVDRTGEATDFTFSGGELEAWAGHWFNWEPASASITSSEWLLEAPATAAQQDGPGTGMGSENACVPIGDSGIMLCIDATAIPLLLRINGLDCEGPFSLHVVGTDPRDKRYEIESSTVQHSVSIAIPWNRRHSIQVTVEDSTGQSVMQTIECEYRIRQNELFGLDATRYEGSPYEGAWAQVANVRDDQLHTESKAAVAQLSSGHAEAVAPWPGLYIFQIDPSEVDVEVTVGPSENFQLEIRGMCEDYEPQPFGFSNLDEHLPRMAADGINAVQFIKKLTMNDLHDSVVYDPCPYPDWDEKLACAIREAKSAGFTVMLRVVLWLDAPWPESDATMQALEPDDWAAWFRSYGEFIRDYADLAEDTGVDVYQFADNLHSTYCREGDYRSLIAQIRSRFSGSLLVSTGPWFRNGLDQVGFWDALDYIGVCGSFHTQATTPYATAVQMKTDEVYQVYKSLFEREILPTARRFQKRVLCCEAYYPSGVGTTYSPNGMSNWGSTVADYTYAPPVSFSEQARGYDAYVRVIADYSDVFAGMFALQWCLRDLTGVLASRPWHNIYATPSEGLFALWWDGLPTPAGTPVTIAGCVSLEAQWFLWTFGGATGSVSVGGGAPVAIDEQGVVNVGHNSPIDVAYTNPGALFHSVCTLLLTFVGGAQDLSGYSGILLAASAEPAASFQIELDYGDEWIQCMSQLVEIGSQRGLYYVAFDELTVAEHARTQYGLGENEIDLSQVRGIRVNLLSREGTLHIYQFSPVTGNW